jgi:hypothetical protein
MNDRHTAIRLLASPRGQSRLHSQSHPFGQSRDGGTNLRLSRTLDDRELAGQPHFRVSAFSHTIPAWHLRIFAFFLFSYYLFETATRVAFVDRTREDAIEGLSRGVTAPLTRGDGRLNRVR